MTAFVPQCHGCRKRKPIVLRTRGMNYCEGCKSRAPTREQFENFLNEKSVRDSNIQVDTRRSSSSLGGFREKN